MPEFYVSTTHGTLITADTKAGAARQFVEKLAKDKGAHLPFTAVVNVTNKNHVTEYGLEVKAVAIVQDQVQELEA